MIHVNCQQKHSRRQGLARRRFSSDRIDLERCSSLNVSSVAYRKNASYVQAERKKERKIGRLMIHTFNEWLCLVDDTTYSYMTLSPHTIKIPIQFNNKSMARICKLGHPPAALEHDMSMMNSNATPDNLSATISSSCAAHADFTTLLIGHTLASHGTSLFSQCRCHSLGRP